MNILFVNSVCGIRSTGRIVTDAAEEYMAKGHKVSVAFGREEAPEKYRDISYKIGLDKKVIINGIKARIFDNEGFNAKKETKEFIEFANKFNPDVLWLHNIHGYYINIEMLFNWIKSRPQMEVKWTLHDCWAFTGHCSHFDFVGCEKWKNGCSNCIQKKAYPTSLIFDNSKNNYEKKKELFCGVKRMTILTPSQWLKNKVEQSFLKEYPIVVLHNSIDKNSFKPTESDFRKKYNLEGKIVILGVASSWSARKGLYDFASLSGMLEEKYKIILVGVTEKQKKEMPENILCLPCTNSKKELAEIYTASDILLSLSKEETFGLTIIEGLSCGAYPIVYKGTACEEVVNQNSGIAVEQNLINVKEAIDQVASIIEKNVRM